MQIREHIKELLNKKLKIEKVISQKELASICDVSPAAITKWLSGVGVPDIEIIPTVCKSLNISLYEFFGLESEEILSNEDRLLLDKISQNPVLKDIISNYKKA